MKDGNNQQKNTTLPSSLDFQDLKVIAPVGRGAKGVVFLTKTGPTGDQSCMALKVISKALIEKKNKEGRGGDGGEYKRVSFEESVLRRLDHALLPRLRGVIETDKILGFGIDYCHGGNLLSLRNKQSEKMFSDDTIRFYAVELVLALEYLHNLGIVYRDLKPDNIMIQQNGHIMLVDFDLSTMLNKKSTKSLSLDSFKSFNLETQKKHARRKKFSFSRFYSCNSGISPCDSDLENQLRLYNNSMSRSEFDSVEKSNSFVGTEEYVAPEIVAGKGHDFSADWWSYGVVLYEMLYGTTPFTGANREETFHRILRKEPELTGEKTALRDLIKRLLEKDPSRRIKVDEIKGHDFFKGVKWDTVLEIARPPYIPANEVGDTVGFSKKDVELFVHGVYFPKSDDAGNEGEKNNKGVEKIESNCENNNNNKKLSHGQTENEEFYIF
ncbi:hypothetical protein RIF29_18699 [Crotalaria pallida]|uniref:non-specific serine/threonine protein kinase n=1 Tax=Crotalaria pallida TaxID=3830 RepID=A0AAN9EZW6_CROPI